jgi:UDP-perosamine 4-acetyltransferase
MMPTENLVIFGAGAHGRVTLDILRSAGATVRAFVDDAVARNQESLLGVPVWSRAQLDSRARPEETAAFVAIGNSDVRLHLARQVQEAGFRLTNVIHSTAQALPTAQLGVNVFVGPLVVIGTSADIADGVVLNTRCAVDHDAVIGRGAYLSPGVTTAGGVIVEERAFVGLGALLGPNVRVGTQAVVGAGAVVLGSVPAFSLVAGSPARLVRRLQPPLDYVRLLSGARSASEGKLPEPVQGSVS